MSRSWRLFRNVPDKDDFLYADVLFACFGKSSQIVTAEKEASIRVWMSPFQGTEEDNKPKVDL